MKYLIAIPCIMMAGCAGIDAPRPTDISLVGHGLSKHAVQGRKSGKPYNETNPGAAIRVGLSQDWAVQVGGYRNSYNKNSGYVIADWSPLSWRHATSCIRLTGGAFAGVATGYPHKQFGGAAPAVGVQGAVHCDRFFARVRVAPATRAKAVGMVEVGVKLLEF